MISPQKLDEVVALVKTYLTEEADAGFPRLSLCPSSYTIKFLDCFATLGAADARALKARPGKPALHVTRHYFDAQDRLVMATVGLYPSDRFSHNTRFRIQQTEGKETR